MPVAAREADLEADVTVRWDVATAAFFALYDVLAYELPDDGPGGARERILALLDDGIGRRGEPSRGEQLGARVALAVLRAAGVAVGPV